MKTLRFIFVALMTLFSVNSFSQTTHTFTLDNTDWGGTTGSTEVQVGDVINFVNGYDNVVFWATLNGLNQPGYPQTYIVGQTIYSYTVPNMAPFVIRVWANAAISEEISFTVTQSTANIDENILTYNVYPNPTTDFINIDGVDVQSVKVFDMSGQIVLNGSSNKIDVSNLQNGFYTLLVNGNNRIKFFKAN